jgi:hypothetical protein
LIISQRHSQCIKFCVIWDFMIEGFLNSQRWSKDSFKNLLKSQK